jgi:hypothetical protein
LNETLRRALFRSGLDENAVATELGVDPKTSAAGLTAGRLTRGCAGGSPLSLGQTRSICGQNC